MSCIDLAKCQVIWETPKDDPNFKGYAHKYIKQDGSNAIITYNTIDDGTHLYVVNMNVVTGKVNYRQEIFLSEVELTGFKRALAKTFNATFGSVLDAITMGQSGSFEVVDAMNNMLGFQNIGFDYNVFDYKGKLIFVTNTYADMLNPADRKSPGEGVVAVDPATGIVYKKYFQIANDLNDIKIKYVTSPYVDGKYLIIPGDRLVGFDLDKGEKLWEIKDDMFPVTSIGIIDGIVYDLCY
jgi:hypothetical protein